MNATETVANWFATTRFEDIPSDALRAAKETVYDCVGLMVAGSTEPLGRIIETYVINLGGTPEATVLASGAKTVSENAALANGAMGMSMDYDPEPQMMGIAAALLALAEKTGASEQDLLTAFVLGAELGDVIGGVAVTDMEHRGLHHHGVLGAIATAAACAKLVNAGHRHIAMAMGMAGSLGGGLLQSEGTMTKPLLGGLIARDGLMAARLTALGMTSGEQLLDHPAGFCGTPITEGVADLTKLVQSLGRPFRIRQFKYVRQYPCCRANHGALDSVLGLMREGRFGASDVARVEIDQSYRSIVMRYQYPSDEHEARFSIRYTLAAALVDAELGVAQFAPEKIKSPEIQRMIEKIHINVLTQWEAGSGDYNDAVPVTIRLNDGRVFRRTTAPDEILGSFNNPLGSEFLVEKFRQNLSMTLPVEKVERAVAVWSPEGEISDLSDAIKLLRPD